MRVSCIDCLYLRKVPDQMMLFCKKNNFQKFVKVRESEISKDGTIRLKDRRAFRLAWTCPAFVTMEDETVTEGA